MPVPCLTAPDLIAGAHFTICCCVRTATRGQPPSRWLPCQQPPRRHWAQVPDAGQHLALSTVCWRFGGLGFTCGEQPCLWRCRHWPCNWTSSAGYVTGFEVPQHILQASIDSQSSVGPVPQSGVRDLEKAGHSLHGEKAARRQVDAEFGDICRAASPAVARSTVALYKLYP